MFKEDTMRFGINTFLLAFPTFTISIIESVPKFKILLMFVYFVFTGKLESKLNIFPPTKRSLKYRDTLSFTLILVIMTDVFITTSS